MRRQPSSRPGKATACVLCVLTWAASTTSPALGDPLAPAAASAPLGKAACLDAVSRGQRLREAHKLVEAREQLRVCARGECPAVVQTDCANWVIELDRALPTVVLSAKDGGGRDLVDVKVSVDGQPLASALDGQAVAVDPGLRSFRFDGAEGSTATQQVLVKEGGKLQSVAVVLGGRGESSSPPGPAVASDGGGTPGSTARLLGVVLGAVGVVGMGTGAVVALDAKSRDNRAAGEPGTSRQTDSHGAVTEGNAATVVLVVGAALAAGGVVLWLTAPRARVQVGTDGRQVMLGGTF